MSKSPEVDVGISIHVRNEGLLSLEDLGDILLAFRNKGLILDPGDVDLHVVARHNRRGVGELLFSVSLASPNNFLRLVAVAFLP